MDHNLDTAKNVAGVVAKHLGQSAALSAAQTAGMWTGFAAVALVAAPILKRQERKSQKPQPQS